MSDESWKNWAWNAVVSNGLFLGITFVSVALYRNWATRKRSFVTSIKRGRLPRQQEKKEEFPSSAFCLFVCFVFERMF